MYTNNSNYLGVYYLSIHYFIDTTSSLSNYNEHHLKSQANNTQSVCKMMDSMILHIFPIHSKTILNPIYTCAAFGSMADLFFDNFCDKE